jgi:Protein of unknown function (DUF2924)
MTTTHADIRVIADAEPKTKRADERSTAENVAARLQALEQMDHAALRVEWRRLYRAHPPKRVTRDLLMLGVAWKIQEQAYGGLGATTKRRVADLAATLERDGDVTRSRVARLKPGAKLVREWHGKTHTVIVGEGGFEWKGRHWRSLSVIAREITGGHWSGPRFFGLKEKVRVNAEDAVVETGDA